MLCEEWQIDDEVLGDVERLRHLTNTPTSEELIKLTSEQAMKAANKHTIQLSLVQSLDQPDYCRIEAKIPMHDITFDQLFNGNEGYRAQYYISVGEGATFNNKIVTALIPSILASCKAKTFYDKRDFIKKSLSGSYSKIWVVGDGKAFLNSPAAISIERWSAYWENNQNAFGLRLPLPMSPQLDLKGTFLKEETGEEWVYEGKRERDEDIHNTGWT